VLFQVTIVHSLVPVSIKKKTVCRTGWSTAVSISMVSHHLNTAALLCCCLQVIEKCWCTICFYSGVISTCMSVCIKLAL